MCCRNSGFPPAWQEYDMLSYVWSLDPGVREEIFLSGLTERMFNRSECAEVELVFLMLSDTALMWSEGDLWNLHSYVKLILRIWAVYYIFHSIFKSVFLKCWQWLACTSQQLANHQRCAKYIKDCYIIIYICVQNKETDCTSYISAFTAVKLRCSSFFEPSLVVIK